MHHCIQGWSGICYNGVASPMRKLIDHVKPFPSARVVAFYSFGAAHSTGDLYYDTQTIFNVLKPRLPPGSLHERLSPTRRVWRAAAIAGREPTRLQDGQVDRTD